VALLFYSVAVFGKFSGQKDGAGAGRQLIEISQVFTPENIMQSFRFGHLFAGKRNGIGGGVILVAALEVFRVRGPVKGICGVGPGKAQGLEKQHFQPVLLKFLTTGGDKLFQAGTLGHRNK
jgi:hypothetical protein